MKNTQVTLSCDTCGKEFKRKRSQVSESNYCSRECKNKGQGKVAYKKLCKSVGGDFKEWLEKEYTVNLRSFRNIALEVYGSEKNSSSVGGWMNRLGIPIRDRSDAVKTQWINNDERRKKAADGLRTRITPEVRSRVHRTMLTDEYKEKQRISKTGERNGMFGVTGENNPNWNPERTHDQRIKERKILEYANWRRGVFDRDNYTCQSCGDGKGGNLVAHHLESYHSNKAARYDIDNGVTLCKTCHLEYHRGYGWKNATRQKFEAFVASRQKQTA